jgi:hypothetical protein
LFTPTGIVLPTEAAILQGVQADQNAAAGGNLTTTLTSPSGQEAQSFTAIIGDKNNEIATIVNQVDPSYASGRFQDAIGRFYFLSRIPGAGTVTTAACIGLVNQTVQAGALVQDPSGYLWSALANFTFDSNGQATPQFQCQTDGPIAVYNGQVTIYKATQGWDTCTFSGSGTPGNLVETQADFEYRRQNSVAANAQGSTIAILGSVLGVAEVLDACVIDNPTNAAVEVGSTNYSVAANSVYVGVLGGASTAVAEAIWVKKSLGCSYNGNTSAQVTDTANPGNPIYTVTWQELTQVPIYITVNLAANANLPSNIATLIEAAVQSSFNGQDGGTRSRANTTTFSGRFYAGVTATSPYVGIESINVGTSANPSAQSFTMGIDQTPTLANANIVVNVA